MIKHQSWDSQMIDGVFPTKVKDIDVTDDNLDDVQPQKKCNEKEYRRIWNAAIEAALYEIDDSELYCAVARLKK